MRFDPRFDLYQELGVASNADQETIRRAYREMVFRYHPDRAPEGEQSAYEEKMKRVNVAYDVLSEPDKRAMYDASRDWHFYASHPATMTPPRYIRQPRSGNPRDPYEQFRRVYVHRTVRLEQAARGLPRWAQIFSGLLGGFGMVSGFILGMGLSGFGCLPGALLGFLIGAIVGAVLLYLIVIGIAAALAGWLGYLIADHVGLSVGAVIGVLMSIWWLRIQHGGSRRR